MSHPDGVSERRSSSWFDTDLETRRLTLENRLNDGFQRIEEAALNGTDVTEWESFWMRLLSEYEEVCREFEQAA